MSNVINDNEARVNITYNGQNGDLPDTVHVLSTDGDLRNWVSEAIATGSVPGINASRASFRDHIVDRFGPTGTRPYSLIQLRPKTPFG